MNSSHFPSRFFQLPEDPKIFQTRSTRGIWHSFKKKLNSPRFLHIFSKTKHLRHSRFFKFGWETKCQRSCDFLNSLKIETPWTFKMFSNPFKNKRPGPKIKKKHFEHPKSFQILSKTTPVDPRFFNILSKEKRQQNLSFFKFLKIK